MQFNATVVEDEGDEDDEDEKAVAASFIAAIQQSKQLFSGCEKTLSSHIIGLQGLFSFCHLLSKQHGDGGLLAMPLPQTRLLRARSLARA
jgi:hypothetical protein